MFAKVFRQIFDSSIAEAPEVRFTFIDMLVLADKDGVVDMTHEAIARTTNRPLEVIKKTIAELEAPDPRSRTKDYDGARIKRLDEHRDWGWMICNYRTFRLIASEEQRRESTRLRVKQHREKHTVTQRNAYVTHVKRKLTQDNAKDHRQKQRHKHKQKQRQKKTTEISESSLSFVCDAVVDGWNTLGKPFAKILRLSGQRRVHLQARAEEQIFQEHWAKALVKIKKSSFCHGENNRHWVANFDWFIRPDTVLKLVEGQFDTVSKNPPIKSADESDQKFLEQMNADAPK